tara:strand:- start:2077 stop:2739 length:663 start_codon:yes stop_codon:yes gene_type:complete
MGIANQTVTPGRTSLLDAVNILLENIGEQPVNTLENQQIQDARFAERVLLEFHKEGQVKGWSWNSEHCYPFSKDSSTGEVSIPSNVVQFALDPYVYANRYVLRGQRLYDTTNRTYVMESTVTKIEADVIWLMPWDETPEAYNRWTTIRSARVFSARVLGTDASFRYTAADERDAQTVLERMEQQQEQPNILTGGRNYLPFPTYAPPSGLTTRRLSSGIRI